MYFLKQSQENLLALKEGLSPEFLQVFHNALSKSEIYFRMEKEGIRYECILPNDEYVSFFLTTDGQVKADNEKSRAFALWIAEGENGLSKEELLSYYGSLGEDLYEKATLSEEERKNYLSAHNDFLALLSELSTSISSYREEGRHKIEWVISSRGDEFRIDARIGADKLYMNRNLADFISAYYSGRMLKIGTKYESLPPSSFSKKQEEALSFISKMMGNRRYYDPAARLASEAMVDFAFLIVGDLARLEEREVDVLEPTFVSVRIDEKGNIVTSLPLEKNGYAISKGKKGVYFGTSSIIPLEFASVKAASLFKFVASHPSFPFASLPREMARDFLPLFGEGDLEIDEAYQAKMRIEKPSIACYLSYEENHGVKVETKYYRGQEECDLSLFRLTLPGKRLSDAYRTALENLKIGPSGYFPSEASLLGVLRSDLSELSSTCRLYVDEALSRRKGDDLSSLRIETVSGQDWLSLSLRSDLYSPEELLALYASYKKKKKFVRINGHFVLLENNAVLSRLSENFDVEDLGKQIPLYQILKLRDFGEVRGEAKELIDRLTSFSSLPLPELPAPILEAARPYQKEGIRFLLNLKNLGMPGILSDEMGLGKTLQAIALMSEIEEEKPELVVCPKSLIYNWADEIKKWNPSLKAVPIHSLKKEREKIYRDMKVAGKAVYLVSYDTARNDIDSLKDIEFSFVLLDEAQYIANAFAKKSQAVKSLKAKMKVALTGTPIQNSLLDLWSIFDFLMPGYFPPYSKFKETYGTIEFKGEEARRRLLNKIEPFMLGRKKKDVLQELPDKENLVISIPLSDDQRKAYEAHLEFARAELKEGKGAMVLLSALTRLRQICVSPSLFLEGEFESDKIDFLVDHCLELRENGRKAVIFSSFVGGLHLLEKAFKKVGLVTATIEGDTPAEIRVTLAKRFNESDDINLLLVSLKSGGTGLNLVGADTVFHLDPWWNLAAEKQAEDRTHRIGQKNKVTVYKLVCKDTVEEKVLALQAKKGLLGEVVDEASLARSLSEEDLAYLLS